MFFFYQNLFLFYQPNKSRTSREDESLSLIIPVVIIVAQRVMWSSHMTIDSIWFGHVLVFPWDIYGPSLNPRPFRALPECPGTLWMMPIFGRRTASRRDNLRSRSRAATGFFKFHPDLLGRTFGVLSKSPGIRSWGFVLLFFWCWSQLVPECLSNGLGSKCGTCGLAFGTFVECVGQEKKCDPLIQNFKALGFAWNFQKVCPNFIKNYFKLSK